MQEKPTILDRKIVAKTRLFTVEQIHLRFSNGVERVYERLCRTNRGAVMIVPLLDEDTLLLVREYAGGVDRYELGFPKGFIEKDEEVFDAANREMQEEVGYAAKQFHLLSSMTSSPGYFSSTMPVVVARDLFPQTLEGDEPEPIEVIPWKLDNMDELIQQEDFTEARSIAACFLLRDALQKGML